MRQWTFLKHVFLSILAVVIFWLSNLIMELFIISKATGNIFGDMEASAASIAIIGGQDGPTAIFSANNQLFHITYSAYIIALLIFLALYFPLKKYLES